VAQVIRGVVRDQDGSPVRRARVAIAGGPVPVPDVAILTGDGGEFALTAPAPGTYRVRADADGFASATESVDVGGDEARVEIPLSRD
jgi:Carboxypeptidase regulatory-like domain